MNSIRTIEEVISLIEKGKQGRSFRFINDDSIIVFVRVPWDNPAPAIFLQQRTMTGTKVVEAIWRNEFIAALYSEDQVKIFFRRQGQKMCVRLRCMNVSPADVKNLMVTSQHPDTPEPKSIWTKIKNFFKRRYEQHT